MTSASKPESLSVKQCVCPALCDGKCRDEPPASAPALWQEDSGGGAGSPSPQGAPARATSGALDAQALPWTVAGKGDGVLGQPTLNFTYFILLNGHYSTLLYN